MGEWHRWADWSGRGKGSWSCITSKLWVSALGHTVQLWLVAAHRGAEVPRCVPSVQPVQSTHTAPPARPLLPTSQLSPCTMHRHPCRIPSSAVLLLLPAEELLSVWPGMNCNQIPFRNKWKGFYVRRTSVSLFDLIESFSQMQGANWN